MVLLVVLLLSAHGQFGGGRFRRGYGYTNPEQTKEQEEMEKALDPAFKEDTFTFARLKFGTDDDYRFGLRTWNDDTPDADLTLTYRMYQVTSLKVRPGLNFIDITPQELANFFVFLCSDKASYSVGSTYFVDGGMLKTL